MLFCAWSGRKGLSGEVGMTWEPEASVGSHDLCSTGNFQLEVAVGIVLCLSLMKPPWSALLLSWASPSLRMSSSPKLSILL